MVLSKHDFPAPWDHVSIEFMPAGIARVFLDGPFVSVVNTAHKENDLAPVSLYSYGKLVSGSRGAVKPEIESVNSPSDIGSLALLVQKIETICD